MTLSVVWAALASVVDPEMPVISIVDLGIVRRIELAGDTCVVEYCPTFLGCPARALIAKEIARAVLAIGFEPVVKVNFAPPWTPDQVSATGREALRLANISIGEPAREGSQPAAAGLAGLANDVVECPACRAKTSRLLSAFASTPCRALRRCNACQNVFEQMKPMASPARGPGLRVQLELVRPSLLNQLVSTSSAAQNTIEPTVWECSSAPSV